MEESPATATARGEFPRAAVQPLRPSRRERLVAWVAGAALVTPPWLAGTWPLGAQQITVALAGLAFLLLFAPMFDYRGWPPSPGPGEMLRRLARFPVFWIGLLVFGYGITAASNPWLALTGDTLSWRSIPQPVPHTAWLPHSLESPFWLMNAWRALLVLAPAWLAACAIWTGVETRATLRALIGAVAINGALLALLGVVQEATGAELMFWFYQPSFSVMGATNTTPFDFFASFTLRGQAAAWLVLAFGAAVAMVEWSWRGEGAKRPGPWWGRSARADLAWAAVLIVLLATFREWARPEFWVFGVAGVLAVWAAVWVGRWWRASRRRDAAIGWPTVALLIVLALGAVLLVGWWRAGRGAPRGMDIEASSPSLVTRYQLARSAVAMLREEPLFGWGPGSYRYFAPSFLQRNAYFTDARGNLRILANHAHSDWAQLAAEWGLAGAALFAAGLAWLLGSVWRLRRTMADDLWCLLAAVAGVMLLAWVDFPFANAAVLLAVAGLLACALKHAVLAARRAPGAPQTVNPFR